METVSDLFWSTLQSGNNTWMTKPCMSQEELPTKITNLDWITEKRSAIGLNGITHTEDMIQHSCLT